MSKYTILHSDYDFVEHLETDLYEFNGVNLDKDNTRYDIHNNGFVWLDNFGLAWNMSAITIVKKIDDTYDIVAVRD